MPDSDKNSSIISEDSSGKCSSSGGDLGAKRGRSLLTIILWFIIISIIAWIVLWSWKPTFVQQVDSQGNATGEPDGAKVLIASIIIGVLGIILIYLLWFCCI